MYAHDQILMVDLAGEICLYIAQAKLSHLPIFAFNISKQLTVHLCPPCEMRSFAYCYLGARGGLKQSKMGGGAGR